MIFDAGYKETKTFNLYYKGSRTDMTYTLRNPESQVMKDLIRNYAKKNARQKTEEARIGVGEEFAREQFITMIVGWDNFKEMVDGKETVMECTDENKGKIYDDPKYALVVDAIRANYEDKEAFF